MTNDAQQFVLGHWAGPPSVSTFASKPLMGGIVLHMHRIDQRNQHVHVQQVAGHVKLVRAGCPATG